MRSFCLGSGSAGNCFYIESLENNKFLVDLGFSFKRTKKILFDRDIDIFSIDGVFITHEHVDHCAGLGVFLKNIKDVKIYLTKGTFEALNLSGVCLDRFVFISENDVVSIGDVKVLVVSKSHDSCEPASFVFENCGVKIGIFTDLGYVSDSIKHIMRDVNVLYLEANYSQRVIFNGDNKFHFNYVNRLSSDLGHLSLSDASSILEEVYKDGQRVILSHVSRNTNSYEKVCLKISDMFERLGKEVDFLVSFQDEPTEWIE